MQDVSQGRERARSWPRKRGKSRSPVTKAQNELFRDQQRAAKYMAPEMLATFMRASEETPFLPRDLSTMMLANRLAIIHMADGRKVYPMPTVLGVSESLDALSQTPGSYLVRGADRWEAGPPPQYGANGCRVIRTSQWYPTAANTRNPITWQEADFQTADLWNPINPQVFTADQAGWYLCRMQGQNLNGGNSFNLWGWNRNGIEDQWDTKAVSSTGSLNWCTVAAMFLCDQGDTLYPFMYANGTNRQWLNMQATIMRL